MDRTNCYSWDFANGQLENISKCFLNNSIFELGRVTHHCGARNYCFLYIEIFLHMPIIQFLCSKCIHLWGHFTSKMTSNMNNLPCNTISARRPWSCKKRQFAQVGLGETLTFSLWKKIMKGRLTEVKFSHFWHKSLTCFFPRLELKINGTLW